MPSDRESSRSSPAAAAGSARTSRASWPQTAGRSSVAARTTRPGRGGRRGDRRAARSSWTSPTASRSSAGESPRSGDSSCSSRTPASAAADGATWEVDPDEWWRVLEVNVLGVHLCCRAVIPGMLERGSGRIVITGSGAAYLPGARRHAYPSSKAAVCRYGETLANELRGRIPVFVISPGLVQTEMTRPLRRRHAVDAARARASARARARLRDARTRSPAGTSTPSTTTSRT